jgi:hypothetical protein
VGFAAEKFAENDPGPDGYRSRISLGQDQSVPVVIGGVEVAPVPVADILP